MYTIKYSQWLSRLVSKRNVVGADRIVGENFFFHFENLACFAVPRSSIIHQANILFIKVWYIFVNLSFKDTTNSKVIFIYRYESSPDILS